MDVKSFEKVNLGPKIWPFENELLKSITLCQFWGKIDGYPLKTVIARPPRGSNDPDPFSPARVLPEVDVGH